MPERLRSWHIPLVHLLFYLHGSRENGNGEAERGREEGETTSNPSEMSHVMRPGDIIEWNSAGQQQYSD